MEYIREPEKQIPVRYDADVFVAGGSCTGVFAAVRAARLGARVVLAERQNCLGGTATAGLVNVWHSLKDTDYKEQIIGGLTDEMVGRLVKSGAAIVQDDPSLAIQFDPNRLQYELDCLVRESRIRVLLHTVCVGAVTEDGRISAALIENKDGRGAVRAGFFIDATGDGDLARYLGIRRYRHPVIQPPTPCFLLRGSTDGIRVENLIRSHGQEFGIPDDFGWYGPVPGVPDIYLRADFHVLGEDCASAEGLTRVEMEGRRKAYALVDLIRRYTDRQVSVAALSSLAGIRESAHYETVYQANGDELLTGARYEDAVLNGTYRVDMHDLDGTVTFKYLDGSAIRMVGAERQSVEWNWREQAGLTGEPARYYQVPFRVLVQERYANFIAAGRMLNADVQAFGALRVMVNLNQLGEAAGVAAFQCLHTGQTVQQVSGVEVRNLLRAGGSCL